MTLKKSDFDGIRLQKSEFLENARTASDNYLAEAYACICDQCNAKALIKRVRSIKSLNLRLGLPNPKSIEAYAIRLAKKGIRRTPSIAMLNAQFRSANIAEPLTEATLLSLWATQFLKKERAFEETGKAIQAEAREKETEAKINLIENARDEAEEERNQSEISDYRADLNAKIFYLCSKHDDCAEDHEAYQGKIYYDHLWKRYIKSEYARDLVSKHIDLYEMQEYQKVLSRPVWLITRPNCRHYFKQISLNDILSEPTLESLLDTHGMHHEVGLRGENQTLRHPMNKEWYTKENVLAIIKKYRERLAYHQKLYDKRPNDQLKNLIFKDKILIRKWERYLKRL